MHTTNIGYNSNDIEHEDESFYNKKGVSCLYSKQNMAASIHEPSPVFPAFPRRAGGIANTTRRRQKQRERDDVIRKQSYYSGIPCIPSCYTQNVSLRKINMSYQNPTVYDTTNSIFVCVDYTVCSMKK